MRDARGDRGALALRSRLQPCAMALEPASPASNAAGTKASKVSLSCACVLQQPCTLFPWFASAHPNSCESRHLLLLAVLSAGDGCDQEERHHYAAGADRVPDGRAHHPGSGGLHVRVLLLSVLAASRS